MHTVFVLIYSRQKVRGRADEHQEYRGLSPEHTDQCRAEKLSERGDQLVGLPQPIRSAWGKHLYL